MKQVHRKLFYAISSLVFLSGCYSIIDDLLSGFNLVIISIDVSVTLVGMIYLILARFFIPVRKLIPSFLIFCNIITISAWFLLGGVYGPAGVGLVASFTVTIILIEEKLTRMVTILCSAILLALSVYQRFGPGLLVDGNEIVTSFPDLIIDYFPLSLGVILLVGFLKTQVDKERDAKERHNRNLQALNEELKSVVAKQNETLLRLQATQARLIETERVATLGRVTAELAHELNNPINFIGGSIYPIEQHLNDIKKSYPKSVNNEHFREIDALLENVKNGAERTSAIVKNLMTVSPKIGESAKDVPLAEVIDTNLAIFDREFPNLKVTVNHNGKIVLGFSAEEQHQIIQNSIRAVIDANYLNADKEFEIKLDIKKSKDRIFFSLEPGQPVTVSDWTRQLEEMQLEDMINSNLGLFVAKSLVFKNDGDMNFQGTGKSGFKVKMSFPIAS